MNYECSESRADFVLLPCQVLIKQGTIKNASIRIGWVLITCYIIKQAVYCCVIQILEPIIGSHTAAEVVMLLGMKQLMTYRSYQLFLCEALS